MAEGPSNVTGSGHRDYSHRRVVDKLGIKPGHAVAFDEASFALDVGLRADVLAQAGGVVLDRDRPPDIVLLTADVSTDVHAHLQAWRSRLHPAGAIWVLTPKRGLAGYLPQTNLITIGLEVGLVDNKVCSVSDTVSAMRFVIRRRDRPARPPTK